MGFVDIAMDACAPHHYKEAEDLATFKSTKTSRGPLQEGWRDDTHPIMCSYKLVDVRFDMMYLMQARIEEFVHKSIREILLVGHRQAFAWVDDWYGMTMEDVREYEARMQQETNEKVKKSPSVSAPTTPDDETTPPFATPTGSTPITPEPGSASKLNRWFSWS